MKDIDKQLTVMVEMQHPQLKGCVIAKLDHSKDYLYRASKARSNRIRVAFTPTTLAHPQRLAIIRRAAMSALEIRRGTTQATQVAQA